MYSIREADESYPIKTRGIDQVFVVVVVVYQHFVMLFICIFMFCLFRLLYFVLFSVFLIFTFTSGPIRSLFMSDDKYDVIKPFLRLRPCAIEEQTLLTRCYRPYVVIYLHSSNDVFLQSTYT